MSGCTQRKALAMLNLDEDKLGVVNVNTIEMSAWSCAKKAE